AAAAAAAKAEPPAAEVSPPRPRLFGVGSSAEEDTPQPWRLPWHRERPEEEEVAEERPRGLRLPWQRPARTPVAE
ncbi:unnamed protein product, partial [Polarella glacialis]